jgi:glc operon protein GlcG
MELPTRSVLTIAVAKKIADAAKACARRKGHPDLIVAIVDPGGHLLYLERGDGVAWGTIDVALLKAQTAVRFNQPSKHLETQLVDGGMTGLVALPGVACFEGAVPIRDDSGTLLGAISVSGLTKELDGEIAQAGADALPRILGGSQSPRRGR